MITASSLARPRLAGAAFLVILAFVTSTAALAQRPPAGIRVSSQGFVENRGQWDSAAKFRGAFGRMAVWVTGDGWTLAAEQRTGFKRGPRKSSEGEPLPVETVLDAVVRMRFEGAKGGSAAGEGRLPARHNWFQGNDPARWVTDVSGFASVRLDGLLPGVAVVAREEDRHFEYDVELAAGTPSDSVVVACEGQDSLFADEHGGVVIRTRFGDFVQTAPVAWEEDDAGARVPLACGWRVLSGGRFGIATPGRDPRRRLVVDPGILWSNLFGGPQDEDPGNSTLALSAGGNLNVAGVTVSPTFPVSPGSFSTTLSGSGTWDAWVARFSPLGTMQWSTFLGGNGFEWAQGLAIGPGDTVTVVGQTSSTNFPAVNAFDSTFNGAGSQGIGDAFLATLNPALSGTAQLTWSTYLGGASDDRLNSVSVDGAGIVTAAGWTWSSNIPGIAPPNAYQPVFQGVQDGIVCQFNPALTGSAQLTWFTFVGGSGQDYFGPLVVMPNGRVVVHGATTSGNYPLVNALQSFLGGNTWDTALSILDPSLSGFAQLVYSTMLGGNGNERENGLDVESSGRITVGGWTTSTNWPVTPGAFNSTYGGGYDAYVTRIDPSQPPASQIVWSTYIGGSADDGINDLYLDQAGTVHAVGSTASGNFPSTPGAYQITTHGGTGGYGPFDAFAFVLDPTGSSLLYSTYIGGYASYDFAFTLAHDGCGQAFISGITRSSDFPATSGAYSAADDTFLLEMELLPAGASRYGAPTPGCSGALEIGVTSIPLNGTTSFAITCAGAPPFSPGLLGISPTALVPPLVVVGLLVWVNPADPGFLLYPTASNGRGYCVQPVYVPGGAAFIGLSGVAQFAWPDPCAPGGLSGSCALALQIQ